ncbi:MAG: SDR family NAD(P)-dependent oxidoreductase [Rhodospirillales bacterium]
MGRLAGKTALVTGGTGGIGSAVCARFAAEGARVMACDVSEPKTPPPAGVTFQAMDVTRADSVRAAMAAAEAAFGGLSVLVNAAGIEIEKTVEETSEEEWDRCLNINLKGMFLSVKYALPLMRRAGGGSIINFGSYDGFAADPSLAAYCASKGGVHALTKAVAVDHSREGIRCNAVCPGYIDTPMLAQFFGDSGDAESLKSKLDALHPVGRIGQPEDIAAMVLWLASDEAAFASGQLFVVDGALTAQAPQMAP